jgi:hypothetical protein
MANEMGIAGERIDGFVRNAMNLLQQFVAEIDVGGSPQGGRA